MKRDEVNRRKMSSKKEEKKEKKEKKEKEKKDKKDKKKDEKKDEKKKEKKEKVKAVVDDFDNALRRLPIWAHEKLEDTDDPFADDFGDDITQPLKVAQEARQNATPEDLLASKNFQ